MALLDHIGSDRRVALASRVLVGRGATADLRLSAGSASAVHAVLIWRDDRWAVRDLGSRNGTLVDGEPVEPGTLRALAEGAVVRFGSDDEVWRLRSAAPPGVVAVTDGALRHGEDGLLALPDADTPSATLFSSASGRWLIEVDGTPRYVEDGEVLTVDGRDWRVALPCGRAGAEASTVAEAARKAPGLQFAVSGDEEFVEVRVGGEVVPTRAFHYMLLTLARLRARDADDGVSRAEQGWVHVDDLCRMLDMDPQRLNVDVYRARQQFAKLKLCEPGRLIERRSTSRQLRFGPTGVGIGRL